MKAVVPWFDYRFSDAGLEIVLGKRVLAKLDYTDIATVRPMSPPKLPSWETMKERAQAFLKRPVVSVKRQKGLLRSWLIAPEDPATFVRELEKRVTLAKKKAEAAAEEPTPKKVAAAS